MTSNLRNASPPPASGHVTAGLLLAATIVLGGWPILTRVQADDQAPDAAPEVAWTFDTGG